MSGKRKNSLVAGNRIKVKAGRITEYIVLGCTREEVDVRLKGMETG